MGNKNDRSLVVGLTGNIGSGKSAAAEIFQSLGAIVIDADILAREVVAPASPGLSEIVKKFGKEFLLPTGELDRKKLGHLVFSEKTKRKQLEEILHPKIRALFRSRLKLIYGKHPIIIYVVPLLFESGYSYDEVDLKVVVTAPREVCIERIMARDKSTRELAERKFDSQIPPEEKESKADFVIRNSSDLVELKRQVAELYKKLQDQRLIMLQRPTKDR